MFDYTVCQIAEWSTYSLGSKKIGEGLISIAGKVYPDLVADASEQLTLMQFLSSITVYAEIFAREKFRRWLVLFIARKILPTLISPIARVTLPEV